MESNVGGQSQGQAVEARLIRAAIVQLPALEPDQAPRSIVETLLGRIRPPRRAARRPLMDFMAANYRAALRFAEEVTQDEELAEDSVSQTFLELLTGRTTTRQFYRALKMNARDVLEKRATERRRTESLEGTVLVGRSPHHEVVGDNDPLDFSSPHPDDQDPLEILLGQEEGRQTSDELEYAVRVVGCRKNRWIKRKEWWKSAGLAELEAGRVAPISGGLPNSK